MVGKNGMCHSVLFMRRDHLIPSIFHKFSKQKIPIYSVLLSLATILILIIFLNPIKIAKLASAFQLLMFAFCCLAVIIMRESHIEAYDPGLKAPFYPWLQIIGIIAPFWLIIEMGWMPIVFSLGLIATGIILYLSYGRKRVERSGAILHVFERLGRRRNEQLEPELRSILKEKGLREDDPYDEIVNKAQVLDITKQTTFENIIKQAADILARELCYPSDKIEKTVLEGTKIGATPVSHGVALPHIRLHNIIDPVLLIIRCKVGISIDADKEFWGEHRPDEPIHAIFFLVSPEENPKQHLRILAKIASRVDDKNFIKDWLDAGGENELKHILIREEQVMTLHIKAGTKSGQLINKTLKELKMPEETLIAVIHREGKTIVPRGEKMILEGDSLTIIGNLEGIHEIRNMYGPKAE